MMVPTYSAAPAMMASQPVPETSPPLSAADRLTLVQTLNALPSAQFDELIFALKPPKGNIPKSSASQSDRSTALLEWVESPIGPGLSDLESLLGKILAKESDTAEEILSFAISGTITSKTKAEVRAIVELLRKKTGDDSIDVAFFKEGSINIFLTGSPEALAQLQELFESGELKEIEGKSIEAVQYINNSTSEARKVRLLQALRLKNKDTRVSDLDLARAITSDLINDLVSDRDRTLVSDLISDLISTRAIAHASDKDLVFARAFSSDLDRTLAHIIDRATTLSSTHTSDLVNALERSRSNALERSRSNQQLNLKRADFTNTYLRKIDLSRANLIEANFTGADLTKANFTKADLTRAILTNAEVTRAVFGENKGLTDAHKIDLQRRGAILLDPPSSDVPSLVLR